MAATMRLIVPIEPFREWLLETYPEHTYIEMGHETGVHERTLRAVMQMERTHITLQLVDLAVTSIGSPDILNELYPLQEE